MGRPPTEGDEDVGGRHSCQVAFISGRGVGHVALTNKGYTIAVPLPGMMRLLVAIPDDTPKGQQPKVTLEELAALASDAIGGPVEIFDPAWITVVRFGNHLAATFRKGRALLAGDAAHSIAPGADRICARPR